MINNQAKRMFANLLTARKIIDVDGPKGWDFGPVPLGRLNIPKKQAANGPHYGIHQVLPLIEVRMPFTLDIWELDNISRGAPDVNLSTVKEAAQKLAEFEERAVYYGFEAAHIKGPRYSCEYEIISCPKDSEQVLCHIPEGISKLKQASIEGPYALVVNPVKWSQLTSYTKGYPLNRQVEEMLGSRMIFCPHIEEMILVSERGGDMKLTLGQDLSIGYEHHDTKEVQLYFTESFTFQVLEPGAVIVFE